MLLYIIRRTYGFKKDSDNISLSQMLGGIRARDGRSSIAVSGSVTKTLLQALRSLEDQHIILTERRQSVEKGDRAPRPIASTSSQTALRQKLRPP